MEQDAVQHVLSQTRANIQFLINAKALSNDQGNDILAKLSSPPPVNTATKPSSSYLFKTRAVWGYNENGEASNDLTFHAGDVIEVTEETNGNWWKGRLKGKEGLFPCKFVERIANEHEAERKNTAFNGVFPGYSSGPLPQQNHAPPYRVGPGPGYAPYPPPQQNYGPPPPNHYQPHYNAPPQQAPPPQIVVNSEPEKKPGMFSGGIGNTLAHSAAGGLGFGAGSAVAGNLVNSIF